jgi:oligopeptide transport system substrate-binding protein
MRAEVRTEYNRIAGGETRHRRRVFVRDGSQRGRVAVVALLLFAFLIVDAGCFLSPDAGSYYGRIVVPRTQEFRWSDGGLPQVFDPAFAAAPPDTDAVRAMFEGLTDYDPQTLAPTPAVATRWESSADGRVWTFYLRADARWSSGEPVTATDFVRSWQRTLKLGDLAPHIELLSNIVGARKSIAPPPNKSEPESTNSKTAVVANRPKREATVREPVFGAEAVSDQVLRVQLQHADPNFPALVAHPVFRPVKTNADEGSNEIAANHVISNGAFHLASRRSDVVSLERAENYWDKGKVSLQRVEFVGGRDAEGELANYRNGDVDAVTNAAFEPLALKLLSPYKDHHRSTYGALTYYSFNTAAPPFDDVRVRQALAISIDRGRISEYEMGGATEPAKKFLPAAFADKVDESVVAKSASLELDIEQARRLLAEAGYPNGDKFPKIRLLINRNEQQRQVAQAIAVMWHNALNVETEITVKNWDEYEAVIRSGGYDLARRGLVMQTTDELTNIRLLFPVDKNIRLQSESIQSLSPAHRALNDHATEAGSRTGPAPRKGEPAIESEADALSQLRAIPIYFASSYALLKPYVIGFDTNILDVPSLKRVRIDSGWRENAGDVRPR